MKPSGPTEEDFRKSILINDAVKKGTIVPRVASEMNVDLYIANLEGLTTLELEEFEEMRKIVPQFETDPKFQRHLVNNLIYHVLKTIDEKALESVTKVEMIKHLVTLRGDSPIAGTGGILENDEEITKYETIMGVKKELLELGTYEKILDWCKNHVPPIELSKWSLAHLKLYALRGFTRDLEKNVPDTVQ
ncbi:MAG TPA: hypothetical protein VGO21_04330 [Candidatus Paceibacterota bacterium]|jgi:hypothetical protein|nr:hypothetical protein [Candidatus Paceibacterota bacterium]